MNNHSCDQDSHAHLRLLAAVRSLEEAVDIDPAQQELKMHATIASMHGLCAAVESARPVIEKEMIDEIIRPAFELHSASPFVRRPQAWPRGYPGDFETIEYLVEGRPRLDRSNKHYWIEWYALNTAVAQQHRNKIVFQRQRIFEGISDGSIILSVGCGGALDMTGVDPRVSDLCCTLVDIDADALELARARLTWAANVSCIRGDVIKVLRRLKRGYHRIVFGGLFDYLSDRTMALTLRLASQLASTTGCRIIFTNVRTRCPFSSWTETMARWPLITRSEDDIRRIIRESGIHDALSIECDATGLSLLCEVSTS